MTIKSWKEENYPIDAKDLRESSDRECIEHSLKKFEGTKKENLKKHNVILYKGDIYFTNGLTCFSFNGLTCALCQKYCLRESSCSNCPLSKIGKQCSASESPWKIFLKDNNPIPMIRALKECLR